MTKVNGVLQQGGIAALPTDTIYGLASLLPFVGKLYGLKGREQLKPIAICVGEIQEIDKYVLSHYVTFSSSEERDRVYSLV